MLTCAEFRSALQTDRPDKGALNEHVDHCETCQAWFSETYLFPLSGNLDSAIGSAQGLNTALQRLRELLKTTTGT